MKQTEGPQGLGGAAVLQLWIGPLFLELQANTGQTDFQFH